MSVDNERRKERNLEIMLATLAKGILLGGSLGIIASWLGIIDIARGLFLGALVGCLGALSVKSMREKKDGK